MMIEIFDPKALRGFTGAVLAKVGVPREAADAVAEGLVEADLYGHATHGLALLPDYVEEIENGTMAVEGRPQVVSDFGAITLWDARRLPGVWTTKLAVAEAAARAKKFGVGAVTVHHSHHIACLAAFLEEPARAGKLALLFSSDPSDAHVAPFGGTTPVMTPNPVAAGIPATPDPILIDVSTSITTAAMCGRARSENRPLPGKWLKDKHGDATDDAFVMKDGGSILPIGGLDHGHKGYGLGLLVEALTQGLGGFGRADGPKDWGAAVLALVFEPAAFGGIDAFVRQTGWLADACRASDVPEGAPPVRLPGAAALARKAAAIAEGLPLDEARLSGLRALSSRLSIPLPPAT
ncbi:Ldh family oxidoreductase [Mesorhizobium sp. CN2-181]|uniref:Ldh family oxidoreductase n=1 Tax=Mesorhizobium yinganensis TaxID=3157707 RepID=UPI0032B7283D